MIYSAHLVDHRANTERCPEMSHSDSPLLLDQSLHFQREKTIEKVAYVRYFHTFISEDLPDFIYSINNLNHPWRENNLYGMNLVRKRFTNTLCFAKNRIWFINVQSYMPFIHFTCLLNLFTSSIFIWKTHCTLFKYMCPVFVKRFVFVWELCVFVFVKYSVHIWKSWSIYKSHSVRLQIRLYF